MNKSRRVYGCPVEFALDVLGGKWKTVVLARLKQSPLRYSELRRTIPALSEKMLSQRLSELVNAGFVGLEADSSGKERYALTAGGRDLATTLQALYDWGVKHSGAMQVQFRSSATLPP
jgi:DNA-binding HxlR family transcriptional regulator